MEENYKVVIVGAGMAGLGSALTFTQNSFTNFVVLEAKETVGGRINTVEVNGKSLDLGAQWLHGKDNPLYELAKKHDLLSEKMSEEGLGMFVRDDGLIFDDFLVKRVDFEIGKILEKCQEFCDETKCEVYPESVGEFLKQEFDRHLFECNDDKDLREMKLELLDWHKRFQVIDNSCTSLKRLSAKSWGEYVCNDDVAHFNLKHGYQSLIDVIVQQLPNDCVQCGVVIEKIYFDNSESVGDQNQLIVLCRNGRRIRCDHVILTCSLGVLKDLLSTDSLPKLPQPMTRAIHNMGFHGIVKIYLVFSEKWWGNAKAFQFLWRHCNNGHYLDTTNKNNWWRAPTGFDEVFGHDTTLLGWVGGEDAVHQIENTDEEIIGQECVELLRLFLSHKFNVPDPIKVIRTKWNSDPYTRGSYCHITPECDTEDSSPINDLAQPLLVDGVPKLFLAGEAVHASHYSTTHGAFESGQTQARLLLDSVNFNKELS